jgi:hypothetical protein
MFRYTFLFGTLLAAVALNACGQGAGLQQIAGPPFEHAKAEPSIHALAHPLSTTHYLYTTTEGSGAPAYQLPLSDSSMPIGQIVVSGSGTDAVANSKYIFVTVPNDGPDTNDIDVYAEPLGPGNTNQEVCDFTNNGEFSPINSNQAVPYKSYLYVVDFVNDTLDQYAGASSADPCPSSPVATTSTGNSPEGIAVNSDYIYVANFSDNTITEYAQGAPFTSGEAPLVTVSGVAKHGGPQWLALSGNDLYVSNMDDYSIAEYHLPLSSGSEPKLRKKMANTCNRVGGNEPSGIAADTMDSPKMLYVATDCGLFGYTLPLRADETQPAVSASSEAFGGMGVR